jgi:hypothetical protein
MTDVQDRTTSAQERADEALRRFADGKLRHPADLRGRRFDADEGRGLF